MDDIRSSNLEKVFNVWVIHLDLVPDMSSKSFVQAFRDLYVSLEFLIVCTVILLDLLLGVPMP